MILNENLFEDYDGSIFPKMLEYGNKIDSLKSYKDVRNFVDNHNELYFDAGTEAGELYIRFDHREDNKTYIVADVSRFINEYKDDLKSFSEELQYNNKRDEDEAEEETFDDSYLFDEDEEDEDEEEIEEQLKTETDPEKRREIVSEISDLADEAEKCEDSNNPYGAADAREEIKKLEEDMTLPAVSDEEILKTEESPSEKVEDNAYSNAIIDAVNDEWATVQKYQDIVNQLSDHEEFKKYIPVIDGIIKDEKNHIGNLQKVLDEINPTTLPDIKDGEEEATEKMSGEDKEENK